MTLVDAALEQGPELRLSYIESACSDDPILRAEVEKRVRWEEQIQSFLRDAVTTTLEKLNPTFEPGTESVIPCDTAILAMLLAA